VASDPERALRTQAYMKSEMPYLGVRMPVLRQVCRAAFAEHGEEGWEDAVQRLWQEAEYREERYAALVLLRRHEREASLALVEEFVVDGAWWDYVDSLAHVAGAVLRRDPSIAGEMRAWSRSPDRWKRRVSIICQLGFRERTDLALLYDCIEPNLGDRDFFVRKAIGWALREYSKTDAGEVLRYVREHADQLSPLSRREALAWLRAERPHLVEET
jgi:3-methyladenine DNA glycosylase AlkD